MLALTAVGSHPPLSLPCMRVVMPHSHSPQLALVLPLHARLLLGHHHFAPHGRVEAVGLAQLPLRPLQLQRRTGRGVSKRLVSTEAPQLHLPTTATPTRTRTRTHHSHLHPHPRYHPQPPPPPPPPPPARRPTTPTCTATSSLSPSTFLLSSSSRFMR